MANLAHVARARASESEQTHTQIINRALRDAALAPTVFDALDCCADALRQLAEMSRAEVRSHG